MSQQQFWRLQLVTSQVHVLAEGEAPSPSTRLNIVADQGGISLA